MRRLTSLAGLLAGVLPVMALASPAFSDLSDLSSVLAPPPAADYQAFPNGMLGPQHIGPLDASTLASESSDPTAAASALTSAGYTGGYRKAWKEPATGTVLIETVLEFQQSSSAQAYLANLKHDEATNNPNFRMFFDTPGLSPAYGSRDVTPANVDLDTVAFTKRNLFLDVSLGLSNQPNHQPALTQATAQYDRIPAATPQPAGPTASDPFAAVGRLVGILLVVSVIVIVPIVLSRRRSRPLAAVDRVGSAGTPTLSSDGRYWWDGAAWQDTAAVAPPTAPRSPDGAYWFDGVRWRPVPR